MRVFEKVLAIIVNNPQNGHALRNIENVRSLAKAKKEIELLLKVKKQGS